MVSTPATHTRRAAASGVQALTQVTAVEKGTGERETEATGNGATTVSGAGIPPCPGAGLPPCPGAGPPPCPGAGLPRCPGAGPPPCRGRGYRCVPNPRAVSGGTTLPPARPLSAFRSFFQRVCFSRSHSFSCSLASLSRTRARHSHPRP